MVSLKKKEKGFTIVELLIVIVVIGILAALVIVTFSGVQRKARDSERTTDIGAVSSHLEAFHAEKGYYPALADNMASDTWVQANMQGLDLNALRDPRNKDSNSMVGAVAANRYAYVADGCTGTAPAQECTSFVLTATPENGDPIVKNSLN